MRTAKRIISTFLCLIMILGCLSACGSMTGSSDDGLQAELTKQYEELLPDLGVRAEEWEKEYKKCNKEEKRIMQYYFITSSMSDLCSLDFSVLRSYASHAAKLRKEMPWTRELDEDTFLCYVAPYRTYKEPVVDCRPFLYDQLIDRIKDRSLTEAILLVNYWCGEQATYEPTDGREFSPMGMYNGGAGRCGEEACFVVNALRSVGIPARVCNTAWTVMADGHSFVQVLVDGEWHFIGGCEPDPTLDSGWFTGRLGSVLTALSYYRSDIGIGQPANYWKSLYSVNDIGSFTDTKDITVTVLDKEGRPARDTEVDLVLFQPEMYVQVLDTISTDSEGKAHYSLGLGSIGAFAYIDGDWRYGWIEQEQTELTLSFADKPDYDTWEEYPVRYNEGEIKTVNTYTDEEKKNFFGEKDFNETRAENHANDYDPSRGAAYPDCEENLRYAGRNFGELITFLERDDNPLRSSLVAGLSGKYCREVNADTLEEILAGAISVKGDISDEDFVKGILFPVTEWSYFSAQRADVQKMFSQEEMNAFREDPNTLYSWFADNINEESIRSYKGGVPSLYGALKMGFCPDMYRIDLLMETARAVGIPVCLDEESGRWNYLSKTGWTLADWAYEPGTLNDDAVYSKAHFLFGNKEPYLGAFWAVLRVTDGNDLAYGAYGILEESDEEFEWDLPVGDYAVVLLDTQEEKKGTVYMERVSVKEGSTTELVLP